MKAVVKGLSISKMTKLLRREIMQKIEEAISLLETLKDLMKNAKYIGNPLKSDDRGVTSSSNNWDGINKLEIFLNFYKEDLLSAIDKLLFPGELKEALAKFCEDIDGIFYKKFEASSFHDSIYELYFRHDFQARFESTVENLNSMFLTKKQP